MVTTVHGRLVVVGRLAGIVMCSVDVGVCVISVAVVIKRGTHVAGITIRITVCVILVLVFRAV